MGTVVYIIFVIFALFFACKYDRESNDNTFKMHRYWLMCFFLICISGFSYGLGGDKFSYMRNFETMQGDMPVSQYIYYSLVFKGYMPFWSLLTYIVKNTCDSFYVIQFVQSALVNISICYIVSRYTKRLFTFILLYFSWYFFIFNTEIMREGVAIGFSLFAIEAYFDGKIRKAFALFAVALMFHVSAIVLLVLPFARFRVKPVTLIYALISSFVLWILSDILISKVFLAAMGGTGMLALKVMHYSTMASTFFGYLRKAITFQILPFVIMYSSLHFQEDKEKRYRLERMFSYHLFLGVCGASLAGFDRFRNYAEVYYLICFSDFIFMLFRVKWHLVIRTLACVGTFFLTFLNYIAYYPVTNGYFYQFYIPYTTGANTEDEVYFRKVLHAESSGGGLKTDKNQRDIE